MFFIYPHRYDLSFVSVFLRFVKKHTEPLESETEELQGNLEH